jgi:hypothetical protein
MSSKARFEFAHRVSTHPRGDADPAGLGQRFEPCRDVHSVPEDVVVLDNNVALVNADAELDAVVQRRRCIALRHASLHLGRAAQGIDHACKFSQHAVAGVLYDAAAMLLDFRANQITEMRLEAFVGAFFIGTHQARIARHIGGEDRGKAAGRVHSSGMPALRRPAK